LAGRRSGQAAARAQAAEGRAEATQARLDLVAAYGEPAATRLLTRTDKSWGQPSRDHDDQRERAVTAEERACAADAECERSAGQLEELRGRLAAAQAAARLVLPALIDLSRDRGDGVVGVMLPAAGIESVTRDPDGAVVP
jgi:hypothetical protein